MFNRFRSITSLFRFDILSVPGIDELVERLVRHERLLLKLSVISGLTPDEIFSNLGEEQANLTKRIDWMQFSLEFYLKYGRMPSEWNEIAAHQLGLM